MTILNGLGFSRLIKTVVPGLLLVGIVGGYADLISSFVGHGDPVFQWAQRNVSLAAALALPLSIALGILSNTVMFGWANDRLIRQQFDREQPGVSRMEQELLEHAIALKASDFKQQLADAQVILDLEYLLIGEVELEKLTFLQESYWYYLDFQMNVGLALALAAPLLAGLSAKGILLLSPKIWIAVTLGIAVIPLSALLLMFLLKAARLNYHKHRVKRLSLLIAAADTAARSREVTEGNELKSPAELLRWLRRSRRSLPQSCAPPTHDQRSRSA
jgi:hypothetical protein